MKRLRAAVASAAVLAAATGGLLLGLSGSANAATPPPWEPDANSVGGLLFFDSSGNTVTGGNVNDPISAYVQGTATVRSGDTVASLYGYLPKNGQAPGAWSGEQLAGPSTFPNSSAPSSTSSTLPLLTSSGTDLTIATLISDYPNTDTSSDGYGGVYQLRLRTSASGKPANTTYDAADILVSGTGSSATWSVAYTTAPTTTATTTTLSTTPTSPQQVGTSVELDASVSPASAGTIQFEDGTTPIGTPQTVGGSGTASISTSTLSVGSHALNAVFTPASPFVGSSTGTTSFSVTAAPAADTTTALSVNPTTAPAYTAVALDANVVKTGSSASVGAAGTVKFFDNGTTLLGSSSLDASGDASISYSAFAVGTHEITAQFVPSDSTVDNTSTSAQVPFTATSPLSTPDEQTVDVSIPAGSLTITSPYDPTNPFHLGTATLDPGDGFFTASQPFGDAANPLDGVTITDTRAGDQPWTASATVTDFTNASSNVINGQNLSFTGVTPSYLTGNALQSGDVVTTDVTSAGDYSASATGSDGLKGGPHAFATAAHGDGSVNVDGTLALKAPTSTVAGTYTATLTFTIA
ncbi:MAG TPA: Ig-like domain-containing protein [Mycobacteriales bacterium]|nr:Ig-like domain-containing protein [Mycobacteriales bacterium]